MKEEGNSQAKDRLQGDGDGSEDERRANWTAEFTTSNELNIVAPSNKPCTGTGRAIEEAEPKGIQDRRDHHRQSHEDGRQYQEIRCEAISQIQAFA